MELEKFVKCGDPKQAFARVRCPDCKEEFFVAFSCRQRGCCPSCDQKRALLLGHRLRCEGCGHEVVLYNSCRNRHCPSCQARARAEWVQRRLEDLLPVSYFHLVFTLPAQLRDIALRNRKPLYAIMFRAVNELLRELAANPQ